MILAEIILGARSWLGVSLALLGIGALVLVWAYTRLPSPARLRGVCLTLKLLALVLLVVCLLEPLYVGSRPRPGSNLFLVVADNSRSLQLFDEGQSQTRAAKLKAALADDAAWHTRLAQDFEVRRYTFDSTLQPVPDFAPLNFTGESSTLAGALQALGQRYRGQPVAGILLLSDGNATDISEREPAWQDLPPVYPVAVATGSPAADVALTQVAVSQTNFEASPVTIATEIATRSLSGKQVVVRVLDDQDQELERQTISITKPDEQLSQRFLIKPQKPGISFYHVQAAIAGEEQLKLDDGKTAEATLANNRRLATVDRGGGPYRVLYVAGTPNWEYKFLHRAIEKDDEVSLLGLVRIAKKEPKFTFLSRADEATNPLFRGFGNKNDERAEQYDEPVLLRFGAKDKDELRGGFPKDIEELYGFHAVILDDIEAGFFTQDQMSLLQQFVSQRGGGLLMLGGKDSFGEGNFARTPIGEMLPVYLDRSTPEPAAQGYRLKLTREGWLQPWVRTRPNEQDELKRISEMPAFLSLNRVDAIKPGAAVLAEIETQGGATRPALVVQPFGRGRSAALLVGDLWRWDLRRPDHAQSDLEKSWRQTVRWLVADVPKNVEVETERVLTAGLENRQILVRARDAKFSPLDNALVKISITTPDQRTIDIQAESSARNAGEYQALFAPRTPGAYLAKVVVQAPDGSPVGERETGWTVEPGSEEFRELAGNQALLERIAQQTGGEVVPLSGLGGFVAGLPNRKLPVVETWTYPLWHSWTVLALAMGCLVGEWGLRRWKGLP